MGVACSMKRSCSARTASFTRSSGTIQVMRKDDVAVPAGTIPMRAQRCGAGANVVVGRIDAGADRADGGQPVDELRPAAEPASSVPL